VTSARDALVKIATVGPFDIIFCDLMMPEVNGMEFYRALAKTAPELRHRLVFMTGGVFSQKTNDFLDTVPNTCIEKPFDIAALLTLIRDRVEAG
jgi:two-component system NtrC family sensor kinase